MSYVPIQELLKNTGSIYKTVIVASKRAMELNEGQVKLVPSDSSKITTIALEEIMKGRLTYKKKSTKKEEKK